MEQAIQHTAAQLVQALLMAKLNLVTAESLTGGRLSAAIVDIPGASEVFSGGAVVYATELKAELLGVDQELLDTKGPVDAEVVGQLAEGARKELGIFGIDQTIGLATTGVAGPEPQGGKAVGTVFIGVSTKNSQQAFPFTFTGSRREIQDQTVLRALELAIQTVKDGIRE